MRIDFGACAHAIAGSPPAAIRDAPPFRIVRLFIVSPESWRLMVLANNCSRNAHTTGMAADQVGSGTEDARAGPDDLQFNMFHFWPKEDVFFCTTRRAGLT